VDSWTLVVPVGSKNDRGAPAPKSPGEEASVTGVDDPPFVANAVKKLSVHTLIVNGDVVAANVWENT
jgi:hypothetical protein